jgi:hypothetical protein
MTLIKCFYTDSIILNKKRKDQRSVTCDSILYLEHLIGLIVSFQVLFQEILKELQ